MNDPRKKKLRSHFFENFHKPFGRCLAPGMSCNETAIRAHSVQNSRVLDLLVRDGHVKAPRIKIDSVRGPIISIEDIGRNQATTFTGFCSPHDSTIFNPLDSRAFDHRDPDHKFLAAYRAVSRELHAQMEGAVRIQGNYQKGVELGLDSGNEPTVAGMVAVEYMMKSYQTYEYKIPFDEALVSGNYDAISHDVITINHEEPTIAVCSLLSIDRMFRNGDWVRVALNVVPLSTTESVAVFSYLTQDADLARTALHRLVTAEGFYQKYLLSKLILNNCENFVVSPAYYDRWTPEKKKAINEYFIETLTEGNLDVEDQNLYLF